MATSNTSIIIRNVVVGALATIAAIPKSRSLLASRGCFCCPLLALGIVGPASGRLSCLGNLALSFIRRSVLILLALGVSGPVVCLLPGIWIRAVIVSALRVGGLLLSEAAEHGLLILSSIELLRIGVLKRRSRRCLFSVWLRRVSKGDGSGIACQTSQQKAILRLLVLL